VSKQVTKIQNRKFKACRFFCFILLTCLLAGLGEFRIRDLNDEINKLLREKKRWEERILELGGADLGVRTIKVF
jgi:hypothetical protein